MPSGEWLGLIVARFCRSLQVVAVNISLSTDVSHVCLNSCLCMLCMFGRSFG